MTMQEAYPITSTEQNAIDLIHSLTAEQIQELAEFTQLVYAAGFDHGAGYGNNLADHRWEDDRNLIRILIQQAKALHWRKTGSMGK